MTDVTESDFESWVEIQLEQPGETAEDDWLAEAATGIVASWREFSARTATALARGEISDDDRLAMLAKLDKTMGDLARLIAEARR